MSSNAMNSIIKVENLGKRYHIGASQPAYGTLRDTVAAAFRSPAALWQRRNGSKDTDIIWALRDITFDVLAGEVVGIVGRNGAGKSTLLKIISRITEPTTGRIQLFGRTGSLLEVGTGFHPELSGRENILLNGAILGMRREEIRRKFDEIVSFAEVEKFIDTPVKRYSSGMYMRLAFAVAAHLDPEILIVDEVLAVGDTSFQKKCLGKMSQAAQEGRTVLFVSHNMVAVQSMCSRVIWLDEGKVVANGPTQTVISKYFDAAGGTNTSLVESWNDLEEAPGNESVRLQKISVGPQDETFSGPLTMKTPLAVEIEYRNLMPDLNLNVTLHLYTEQGIIAFTTGSSRDTRWDRPFPPGLFRSTCYIPGELLNAGRHRFVIFFVKDKSSVIYRYDSKVLFEINDLQERDGGWYGKEPGVVQPALEWNTEQLDGSDSVAGAIRVSSALPERSSGG